MPFDVKWRKREKRNDKEHHIKASFFSYRWVFERFLFCFVFEKTSSSLPMLFVHIGKSSSENLRSNRSQVFLKISQCSQKTPVFESLFNKVGVLKTCIFIKKEIPTQVSSCKYCEIFKNSFFVQHFLFIILLRDDRILWTPLGTKLTCFIFLVLLLCFPSYRESIVISYLFLYQNF